MRFDFILFIFFFDVLISSNFEEKWRWFEWYNLTYSKIRKCDSSWLYQMQQTHWQKISLKVITKIIDSILILHEFIDKQNFIHNNNKRSRHRIFLNVVNILCSKKYLIYLKLYYTKPLFYYCFINVHNTKSISPKIHGSSCIGTRKLFKKSLKRHYKF